MDPIQINQVRHLIADLDPARQLLTDTHISTYLSMNSGRVWAAAADALDAIATSEALVSKKIRTQDLSTDGAAVASELRAQARRLRDRQQTEDEDVAGWSGFTLTDVTPPSGGGRRPEHTNHPVVWGL